jgi:hypothetical protein
VQLVEQVQAYQPQEQAMLEQVQALARHPGLEQALRGLVQGQEQESEQKLV